MFQLSKAWHWIGVHGHNFLVQAFGWEKVIVRNRKTIEKVEQDVANDIDLGISFVNPVLAADLMRILPAFSASFAKCLEALARTNADAGSNIVQMEFEPEFVQLLQTAGLALENQRPGSTTPPAFLFPPSK